MSENTVSVVETERLQPQTPGKEHVVALSLLDATVANFALTNATWLFEKPPESSNVDFQQLAAGLKDSLRTALDAYPWWCGRVKMVMTADGNTAHEATHLPPHARRYGRLYVQYGASDDPGVEVVTATSLETLDSLYPEQRTTAQPIWSGKDAPLGPFIPSSPQVNPRQPDELDANGRRKAPLAVQVTGLACGGWTLAVKSTHPLADITTLVTFVKDWATLHQSKITGQPKPQLYRQLESWRVDDLAAGDINADSPDPVIVGTTTSLPFHRYDWWHPAAEKTCPWPVEVPEVFKDEVQRPVGKVMPWEEWDVTAPVSNYTLHFSHAQVEDLYKNAASSADGVTENGSSRRISRHDAVLAHIWSCIVRARRLQDDEDPVHCDLTYGLRPVLGLGESFVGSPIILVNVELSGRTASSSLPPVAQKIRETISSVKPSDLSAHLHAVSFEKTPQRLWQAFLGRRHILVTTWARAGLYDVDFFRSGGDSSGIRYADGLMPPLDGVILIKEAPPSGRKVDSSKPRSWTEDGVDISIHLRTEDMERLIADPLLLPALG
jgi:hypothetical protein